MKEKVDSVKFGIFALSCFEGQILIPGKRIKPDCLRTVASLILVLKFLALKLVLLVCSLVTEINNTMPKLIAFKLEAELPNCVNKYREI